MREGGGAKAGGGGGRLQGQSFEVSMFDADLQ